MIVRLAIEADAERLAEIDDQRYGKLDLQSSADIFEQRIRSAPSWIWVCEIDGEIEGLLSLMPTTVTPETFKSWQVTTADGTLIGKVEADGRYVYGVALTMTSAGAIADGHSALMAHAAAKVVRERKEAVIFSSRLPGMLRYHRRGLSPIEYYDERFVDSQGISVALDPELRMYEAMGMERLRLVEGAFPGDKMSLEYGAILIARNPFIRWPFPTVVAWVVRALAGNPRAMEKVLNIAG